MLEIIDYSEKAFAVIGDTKPVKDQLKELGGRWNSHLKCGAGWIFSKRHLGAVENAFRITMSERVLPRELEMPDVNPAGEPFTEHAEGGNGNGWWRR